MAAKLKTAAKKPAAKAAARKKVGLTPKQARFVEEYLIDQNATQAAIRAGYSAKTAASQGERLLRNVEVAKAIHAAQVARSRRTQIDADYVVSRMVEIDQMDVLDIMNDDMSLKPVSQWPHSWRRYLSGFDVSELFDGYGEDREMSGFLKKIRWPDKIRNLEMLARHLGMFPSKVEHTGKNGGPIEMATLSREEYKQARQEMLADDDC